jgi:hypothetical protein
MKWSIILLMLCWPLLTSIAPAPGYRIARAQPADCYEVNAAFVRRATVTVSYAGRDLPVGLAVAWSCESADAADQQLASNVDLVMRVRHERGLTP